jgi:hypothetical protein
MSKTVRNYTYDGGREGAKIAKFLKLDDAYTGWTGEESWSPDAKRRNKKAANKHNRQLRNALVELETL